MGDVIWHLDAVDLAGVSLSRLEAVTVQIRRGVTAVMGCSGAGKTSLLNLLVEFERPDGGTIARDLRADGFSLPLYWVPQDGGLWPDMTVRQHLRAVTPGAGPGLERVEALLASFDIRARASSYPGELSMGERSRLAVARALAAGAAVLVMDEPLAHVDEARTPRYWEAIREHLADTGASLVFATHAAKSVISEAERVICLKDGRVLYEGEVEKLYWEPGTRAQAECLGEVNWLEADEARLWLGNGHAMRRCYRPEQVAVTPAADGPLVVRSCRFKGSVAEAELEHAETGRVRRFCHRPGAKRLRPGDRVVLKALLCLLVLVLIGCGGGADPVLTVREMHSWAIPSEGRTIPAPRSVAMGAQGEAYVLDTAGRVLVYSADGKCVRRWAMPEVEAGKPEGICVLKDGRIAVCDTHYNRVVLFEHDGTDAGRFGSYGKGPGQFIYPAGIVEDEAGNLYVSEYGGNDRIQKFSPEGDPVLSFGGFGTGPGEFQRPSGMAWHEGRVYVADAMNSRILVFSDDGRFLAVLGGEAPPFLHFPYDVTIGRDGALYVVEYGAGRVCKLSVDGRVLGRCGSPGGGHGQLSTPWGLTAAPGRRLLIADTDNRRMVEWRL